MKLRYTVYKVENPQLGILHYKSCVNGWFGRRRWLRHSGDDYFSYAFAEVCTTVDEALELCRKHMRLQIKDRLYNRTKTTIQTRVTLVEKDGVITCESIL